MYIVPPLPARQCARVTHSFLQLFSVSCPALQGRALWLFKHFCGSFYNSCRPSVILRGNFWYVCCSLYHSLPDSALSQLTFQLPTPMFELLFPCNILSRISLPYLYPSILSRNSGFGEICRVFTFLILLNSRVLRRSMFHPSFLWVGRLTVWHERTELPNKAKFHRQTWPPRYSGDSLTDSGST
jgi:hypothetical protein